MLFDNHQLSRGLSETCLSQLTDLVRNGGLPSGSQAQDWLDVTAARNKSGMNEWGCYCTRMCDLIAN
jgi:hypothetical protein